MLNNSTSVPHQNYIYQKKKPSFVNHSYQEFRKSVYLRPMKDVHDNMYLLVKPILLKCILPRTNVSAKSSML